MPVMPYVNHVIISGNLIKDAELKTLNNGNNLLTFTIANSKKYKVGNDWKEQAGFYNCSVWGKAAEYNKDLAKGQSVLVEGNLSFNSWEDSSGNKRSAIQINATRVLKFNLKSKNAVENTDDDLPDNTENTDEIPF